MVGFLKDRMLFLSWLWAARGRWETEAGRLRVGSGEEVASVPGLEKRVKSQRLGRERALHVKVQCAPRVAGAAPPWRRAWATPAPGLSSTGTAGFGPL